MPETYTKVKHYSYHEDMTNTYVRSGPLSGAASLSSHHVNTLFADSATFSGAKNPWWRNQIRNGVNATTSCSGTLPSGSGEFVTAVSDYNIRNSNGSSWQIIHAEGYGYLPYPTGPSLTTPSNTVIADVTNRCVRRFLDMFEQAFSSDNLTGRSIKHFQHDIHSISNPMKGLRQEISSYLGNLGKVSRGKGPKSRLLREVRAAYLEFSFGIEPFTDDITAILSDLGRYRFPTIPISATAHADYTSSSGTFSPSHMDYVLGTISQSYVKTSTYSLRYKGAVRTQTGMDGKIGFIQSQRLLPQDWIPTLFSILPYAWMVDYFTNIGNIIDGLCFCWNDLAWGCKTARNECTIRYGEPYCSSLPTVPSGFTASVNNTSIYGGSATFKDVSFNRDILVPSDLVPRLVFTIPTKPKQWLNMMFAFAPRISKVVSLLT